MVPCAEPVIRLRADLSMHDADFDHDHEDLYAHSHELEGMERLTLTSVGIDIGSSTSHLLFSRLTLKRDNAGFSTQFRITDRELLWASPILMTPYLSGTTIDFAAIRDFIADCYQKAGLSPAEIDSGAVVITGEALKKENARPIAEYFADDAGKFVCASAGPHHEALLAAHGSGAVQLSRISKSRILNVDIGGGTTKLSLIHNGAVLGTAAINIGARLLALDAGGRVSRLEEAGAALAAAAGIAVATNTAVAIPAREKIAALMAQTLWSLLEDGKGSALAQSLMITERLGATLTDVDYLVFSGGVSEYLHGRTEQNFGDLGAALAQALKPFLGALPAGMLQEPAQGIRATVIGASAYTIQVSGATSFATTTDMLPLQGLKVVHLHHQPGEPFETALAAAFHKFDIAGFGPGLAISISIEGDIDHAVLREIADGLAAATRHDPTSALVLNIEQDVAQSLGNILHREIGLPNPLLAIDGVVVGDLDYIDIGQSIAAVGVFPVTVKSLLFSPETLI